MSEHDNAPWNNEHWRLSLVVKYVRRHPPETVYDPCPHCDSGSFFIFGPEEHCGHCDGRKFIARFLPYPDKPEIPEHVVDFLSRAYKMYVKIRSRSPIRQRQQT